MNWLVVAIVAQVIIGSSAVFDKLLLKKRSIEPWAYTFWFGMLGLFAVVLLPFGYQSTALPVIFLALVGGAFFIASAFLYFRTLEEIEASEALPLLGTLSPIATLAFSALWLGTSLGALDFIGFGFLIASGFFLFLAERKEIDARHLLAIALAGVFLAASHVLSKAVFNETSFITGFFWIKIGGALAVLLPLAWPKLRRAIAVSEHTSARNKVWYFANRGYAAVGSLLVSFAVALSAPPLVDASQNVRYLIIFVLGWLVLREQFRGKALLGKIIAAFLITIGLAALALGEYARSLPPVPAERPIQWRVTFSNKFSRELGLDWQENFRAILDELRPQTLRLIAYWDEVEPNAGEFNFSDLDWQIAEAEKRHIPIILAIGLKLPRWPECHAPVWARGLAAEEQEREVQRYIAEVVERYRERPGIVMWQVENEPFLLFGSCPMRGGDFVEQEIAVVRSLDYRRPILVTDGGEFGLWFRASRLGDVFGTTMYRKAYPRVIGPIFGVIEYPFTPSYFRVKERFTRWVNARPDQQFIVVELQGEPWEPRSLANVPPQELVASFSPDYFRETIEYAKATGFEEYHFWGAEWWWWMKEKHGEPRYWDIARELMRE